MALGLLGTGPARHHGSARHWVAKPVVNPRSAAGGITRAAGAPTGRPVHGDAGRVGTGGEVVGTGEHLMETVEEALVTLDRLVGKSRGLLK